MPIFWLSDNDISFPSPHLAEAEGVLAMGGDLKPQRLLRAYQMGIFPWYNEGEPIIWWSPDPRFVMYPSKLKVSKSMRKVLRDNIFHVTVDTDFKAVIENCQQTYRPDQGGTWITDDMLEAYLELHDLGFAHSVEVWQEGDLVGGLYGVSLGKCFFGESMFTKVSNASKTGFIILVKKLTALGFDLIDCQTHTSHLESLGAEDMDREEFLNYLKQNNKKETLRGKWTKLMEKI